MNSRKRQRGANLAEAAIAIPILMLVVFAIVDFGRAYNVYQVITNAAREGARYSVAPLPGTSTLPNQDNVKAYVLDYLGSGNVQGASVNVNQTFSSTVNSISIVFTEITIDEPYTFSFFPGSITIRTRAVMRNETN